MIKSNIILLVDDDADERSLFVEAAGTINPPVICHVSPDGKEAMEFLEKNSDNLPGVIFLDINMPVMNGWHCLKELKSKERLKDIPVIMYSTSSRQREIDIAIDLGAVCFCVKPENFNMLKQILETVNNNLGSNLVEALKQNNLKLFHF
ncbi:MAG: response regulator [Bacteroidota bacterium]